MMFKFTLPPASFFKNLTLQQRNFPHGFFEEEKCLQTFKVWSPPVVCPPSKAIPQMITSFRTRTKVVLKCFWLEQKEKNLNILQKVLLKSLKILLRNKPLHWLQILLATISIRSSKSREIARSAMSVLDRCNSARRLLG